MPLCLNRSLTDPGSAPSWSWKLTVKASGTFVSLAGSVKVGGIVSVPAYAKETLREMQERLDTAKVDTKADELTGAASAEHAWKMIANQDDRLRVLTAFIASQEAALANS